MSLVKPAGIQGLQTSHALYANITQFLEFGDSNTDLVDSSSFTTGATNADTTDLGKCVLATNANLGVSVDLSIDNGYTVLLVYQHAGDGTPQGGDAAAARLLNYVDSGNSLTFRYRYFTGHDYESMIRGPGIALQRIDLAPYQGQSFLYADPHAVALSPDTRGSATDLIVAYMDGTELTTTNDATQDNPYSGPVAIKLIDEIGTSGDTYLSAAIVFNKRLSSAEMASVTTDPWAMVSTGPALTVTQTELTPGGTISGSYADYATVPTTLTVSDGTNTITIASPTISDNGDGTGTFSGTMPSLPTTGTANLILFGNVTVELS